MDRVESLRASRTSPQVVFSEYLKLRARHDGIVLVFEGRQCPGVYVGWVFAQFAQAQLAQIIARGKKNVLALRDLIHRNKTTLSHRNIYFVDRDYDDYPNQETFVDVYVSRGYSIENEAIERSLIERYIHAHFDIADAEDAAAVASAMSQFDVLLNSYLAASRTTQHLIYACRKRPVTCTPGEDPLRFVQFDWDTGTARPVVTDLGEILTLLGVDEPERAAVIAFMAADTAFVELDPIQYWRGKFHFGFVRGFLTFLRDARLQGTRPFVRKSKLSADPSHPSLLSQLALLKAPPACLVNFLQKFAAQSVLRAAGEQAA